MKILVAIPSNTGRIVYPIPFVHSIWDALQEFKTVYPADRLDIKVWSTLRIDQARNAMVRYAQQEGYAAIIMIDDDMKIPSHTFVQLIKDWDYGARPIVSVTYHSKAYPFHAFICPIGQTNWLTCYPKNQIIEVERLGTGCVLIDATIFDKLAKPYFLLRMDMDGNLACTEDCYFSENCRGNNIKMYVDTGIISNHVDLISFMDFFTDEYIKFKGKMDFNFYEMGNVDVKPRNDCNLNIKPTEILAVPKEGFFWHDGIDECEHLNENIVDLPGLPHRKKCIRCGLIIDG